MNRRHFLRTSSAGLAGLITGQMGGFKAAPAASRGLVKIEDVRSYVLRGAVFVRVLTRNGISGWGECSSNDRPAAAVLHLSAALPNMEPFIEFSGKDRDPHLPGLFHNAIVFEDGALRVPEGPALGLEADQAAIEKMAAG